MSPMGDSGRLVPRVGHLCLGINVPCGQTCPGIIVRGTIVPRNECPGDSGRNGCPGRGHFVCVWRGGGDNHAYDNGMDLLHRPTCY